MDHKEYVEWIKNIKSEKLLEMMKQGQKKAQVQWFRWSFNPTKINWQIDEKVKSVYANFEVGDYGFVVEKIEGEPNVRLRGNNGRNFVEYRSNQMHEIFEKVERVAGWGFNS